MIIKKEDQIGKMLKQFPQTSDVFIEFGLFCVGCPANEFETIEDGARVHGKTDEEITELIKKLNAAIK
jgi:hybrid cluster-associated redox disulfide protein